jgi:hypothetical protein
MHEKVHFHANFFIVVNAEVTPFPLLTHEVDHLGGFIVGRWVGSATLNTLAHGAKSNAP